MPEASCTVTDSKPVELPLTTCCAAVRWKPTGTQRLCRTDRQSVRPSAPAVPTLRVGTSRPSPPDVPFAGRIANPSYEEISSAAPYRFLVLLAAFLVFGVPAGWLITPKRISSRFCSLGEKVRPGVGSTHPSPPVSRAARTNSLIR